MFKPDERCKLPPNDTVIWRYFSFAKFLSLLDQKELFFPSASNLEDPFEGSLPRPDAHGSCFMEEDDQQRSMRRNQILVSSWHINPDESFAMWNLYARSLDSVAIRSTVGRLKAALTSSPYDVLISQVQYIDYQRDHVPHSNHLMPYLCKAKPYSYENEIRAIIDFYNPESRHSQDEKLRKKIIHDRGLYVPTDLIQLIDQVYVAPAAEDWFMNLVRRVIQKFNLDFTPRRSILADRPIY